MIRLGSRENYSEEIVDPQKAEAAFLSAAKYAGAGQPKDAGRAFCGAGRAAYCDGRFAYAEQHTQKALSVHQSLPEAHYQAARIAFFQNHVEQGLRFLRSAIRLDKDYSWKCFSDEVFLRHERSIIGMISNLRDLTLRIADAISESFARS